MKGEKRDVKRVRVSNALFFLFTLFELSPSIPVSTIFFFFLFPYYITACEARGSLFFTHLDIFTHFLPIFYILFLSLLLQSFSTDFHSLILFLFIPFPFTRNETLSLSLLFDSYSCETYISPHKGIGRVSRKERQKKVNL